MDIITKTINNGLWYLNRQKDASFLFRAFSKSGKLDSFNFITACDSQTDHFCQAIHSLLDSHSGATFDASLKGIFQSANSVGYKVKIEATEDTESWNVRLSPTLWKRARNFFG